MPPNFTGMMVKADVIIAYKKMLANKISGLQLVLDDLKHTCANETKSTAGDKHETALAMVQIEQENKRGQMQSLLQLSMQLNAIDPNKQATIAAPGALIKTTEGYFFIVASLGKLQFNSISCYALSPQSPLGQKFLGCKVGDEVTLNNRNYKIEDIY